MKIDWSAFVTNPVYQIGGVVSILVLAGVVAGSQHSCARKHEETAKVEAVKADDAHERLKEAQNEIAELHRKVADLEAATTHYRSEYLRAKAQVASAVVVPAPTQPSELATALQRVGFGPMVRVDDKAEASTLTVSDGGLAYLLAQRAARAESLESALKACDDLQASQAATLAAKDLELKTTNDALKASMDESMHRQAQAVELGKALSVEKKKGWQKYGALALGVVVGYAAKR